MEASTSTKTKAASSDASTKDAEAEPRLSHQAQFSTYEELDRNDWGPGETAPNPPNGHQVVQTPGVAHEGPVENPIAKAKAS